MLFSETVPSGVQPSMENFLHNYVGCTVRRFVLAPNGRVEIKAPGEAATYVLAISILSASPLALHGLGSWAQIGLLDGLSDEAVQGAGLQS